MATARLFRGRRAAPFELFADSGHFGDVIEERNVAKAERTPKSRAVS